MAKTVKVGELDNIPRFLSYRFRLKHRHTHSINDPGHSHSYTVCSGGGFTGGYYDISA